MTWCQSCGDNNPDGSYCSCPDGRARFKADRDRDLAIYGNAFGYVKNGHRYLLCPSDVTFYTSKSEGEVVGEPLTKAAMDERRRLRETGLKELGYEEVPAEQVVENLAQCVEGTKVKG